MYDILILFALDCHSHEFVFKHLPKRTIEYYLHTQHNKQIISWRSREEVDEIFDKEKWHKENKM